MNVIAGDGIGNRSVPIVSGTHDNDLEVEQTTV